MYLINSPWRENGVPVSPGQIPRWVYTVAGRREYGISIGSIVAIWQYLHMHLKDSVGEDLKYPT